MFKSYFKAAIILFALQLFLLTILLNNILMDRFAFFQSYQIHIFELAFGAALFIINIAAIFLIRNMYISSLRTQRLKLESLRFAHIEEQNRIYRQHRHDLNNHLSVISGLAQLGEMDRLRAYLTSYVDAFNKSIVTVDTGLKELDILFFAKIAEAMSKDIQLTFNCVTNIIVSHRHVPSLVTIMANVLDNAIQACEKGRAAKLISITITRDALDYIFSVVNTFNQDSNLEPLLDKEGFTTKQGRERGEGLSIIKKTVNHLEGEYSYDIKEGSFHIRIEIPRHRLEGLA